MHVGCGHCSEAIGVLLPGLPAGVPAGRQRKGSEGDIPAMAEGEASVNIISMGSSWNRLQDHISPPKTCVVLCVDRDLRLESHFGHLARPHTIDCNLHLLSQPFGSPPDAFQPLAGCAIANHQRLGRLQGLGCHCCSFGQAMIVNGGQVTNSKLCGWWIPQRHTSDYPFLPHQAVFFFRQFFFFLCVFHCAAPWENG